jgi:hypothetical protein
MKKLNLDRNSEKDSIYQVLNDASDLWEKLQASGVDNRVLVQEMLTQEEWEKIISKSIDELSKKEVKNLEKEHKNFDKEYDKLQSAIAKQITNPERLKIIDQSFLDFKILLKDYIQSNKEKTLRYNDVFQNLNATKSDLAEAVSFVDESRTKLFDGIVKLHFELTEITTEEEWTKIAKSVNKLF